MMSAGILDIHLVSRRRGETVLASRIAKHYLRDNCASDMLLPRRWHSSSQPPRADDAYVNPGQGA